MNLADFMPLLAVLAFAGMLLGAWLFYRRKGVARGAGIREIEAFQSLPDTVGAAVETGRRLHISLGNGTLGETNTAATLAGLAVLDQISSAAVVSDKPPVITTADATTAFVAQDILKTVYARQNALQTYDADSARVAGVTPLAFGAALTSMIKDESIAGTVLVGPVGPEAVLLTEAGQREKVTTLAGSDDPATQAVLFATADHPLIGEDLFAGGAYIGRIAAHVASLRAQDVIRIVIVLAIIVYSALRTISGG